MKNQRKAMRINLKGIVRNRADGEFQDGECQEIINMRFRDGAWRPVPGKEKVYNALADTYTAIYHHVQDNVDNYVGYIQATGGLYLIDMALGIGTLIKTYMAGAEVKVQFLKRFLLVIHSLGIDKFIYNPTDGYKIVNIIYPPSSILMMASSSHTEITDTASTGEGLLGKLKKSYIEASENWGHLSGGIMYRIAYKLYDGTYVMHTIPRYFQFASLGGVVRKVTGGWRIEYYNAYLYVWINRGYYALFAEMKDIISSVCIFCSKNEVLYNIDEYSLTDDVLDGVTTYKNYGQLFQINEEYKKLADVTGWRKVHEIPFLQASNIYAGLTEAIDMRGFYLDHAVRENLPVDNFSAHSLTANTSFVYNDRLMLGDVTTILGSHSQHYLISNYRESEYDEVAYYHLSYLLFVLSTDAGIAYKLQAIGGKYCTRLSDGKLVAIFDNSVLGYPDSRCTEIRLITENAGAYYVTHTFTMKKSANDNYSYYHSEQFSGDNSTLDTGIYNFDNVEVEIDFTAGNIVNLEIYADTGTIQDQNRVQVSELRNPFYFPAKNSYQVGSGTVTGLGTNTEAISEGQFGQYPLYVFTNKGIWMLQQGSGDVVFASIAPVSGEVSISEVCSVGNGVVFASSRGLYLVAGKQVQRISQAIEGDINSDFYANNHFAYFVNHASLVQLTDSLSDCNFLEYLENAKFGFDKINNELLILNTTYPYIYVYNFEFMSFHKLNNTYSLIIQNYPFLYAVDSDGVTNISSETGTGEVSILAISQPQSLDINEVYKKIERAILRCKIETKTACYFTFAIWATDDLKTYQFVTGGQRTGEVQNIMLSRTHGSNKYFVFAIFGQVAPVSDISSVDFSIISRLAGKLRT
jgi:hypothetical protein